MRQVARLQKPFLDHLAARPGARAKFVSDPLGTLRAFSPAAKRLVDSLGLDDLHTDPMFPAGPDARIESLKVNLKRPQPTPRVARQPKKPR